MGAHRWKFARVGGFDQVELTTGADLVAIGELDQKLWVALACPVKGLELDARTLELVDTDHDGRVRASELIAAVAWARDRVADVEVLAEGADALALESIDGDTADGKLLRESAQAVLASLGKPDAKKLSIADADKALDAFTKRTFNGDGVVTLDAAADDVTKKLLVDVLACTTPATDQGGKPGVTEATVKSFFEEVAAHAAWLVKGDADESTRPLKDATPDAAVALAAVRAKIDDYFARTRVAAFDARALPAVNGAEAEYAAIAAKDLDASAKELLHFPLAHVVAGGVLTLGTGLNPAWRAAMAAFRTKVVVPLLGEKSALTEGDWAALTAKFAGHDAWLATKAGASVEKLGAPRVKELAAPAMKAKLDALLDEEKKAEPLAAAIHSVERLVRYNRDLMALANNFVSFRNFYSKKSPATFQVGTLYLDTRACELCILVADATRHATMAPFANTYLVYCDCKNSKGETMSIAAAMTAGDVDNLMVGRNGVFYDRKGVDWDATITKLIVNPISVRHAFWSPYKRVLRFIEEQVAKRAADAEAAADARHTAAVAHAHAAVAGATPAVPPPPPPPPVPMKLDIGVVAALGVAVGGISAALGVFLSTLFGLGLWMPLGLLGLILAISGPSMAIAWLKLRKRNLGPILDANGWAVNAQAKLNVPFGGSLTKLAVLPPGSSRTLTDPFAEKRRPWGFYLFVVLLLALAGAWYFGKVDRFLPAPVRSVTVLGTNAPGYVPHARPAATR